MGAPHSRRTRGGTHGSRNIGCPGALCSCAHARNWYQRASRRTLARGRSVGSHTESSRNDRGYRHWPARFCAGFPPAHDPLARRESYGHGYPVVARARVGHSGRPEATNAARSSAVPFAAAKIVGRAHASYTTAHSIVAMARLDASPPVRYMYHWPRSSRSEVVCDATLATAEKEARSLTPIVAALVELVGIQGHSSR
jgi:hypothetical protein